MKKMLTGIVLMSLGFVGISYGQQMQPVTKSATKRVVADSAQKKYTGMIPQDMVDAMDLNKTQQDSISKWYKNLQEQEDLADAKVGSNGYAPNQIETMRKETDRKVMGVLDKSQRKTYKKLMSERLKRELSDDNMSNMPAPRPSSIEKQPVGSVNR